MLVQEQLTTDLLGSLLNLRRRVARRHLVLLLLLPLLLPLILLLPTSSSPSSAPTAVQSMANSNYSGTIAGAVIGVLLFLQKQNDSVSYELTSAQRAILQSNTNSVAGEALPADPTLINTSLALSLPGFFIIKGDTVSKRRQNSCWRGCKHL